mgnify:FL=1
MNQTKKRTAAALLAALIAVMTLSFALTVPALADSPDAESAVQTEQSAEAAADKISGTKAYASAIAIGLAAAGGAVAMAIAISKSVEGISRQPEADGKIRTTLMLGLVFIETAIIYALLVIILIIFVL